MSNRFGLRGAVTSFVVAALLAGCGGSTPATSPAPAGSSGSKSGATSQKPIQIGYLNSLSGVFAVPGKAQLIAFKLPFEQHNDVIAGRKVSFVVADDQTTPSVDLTKYRQLVQQDHVSLIYGIITSNGADAVAPYAKRAGVPFISTAGEAQLTRKYQANNIFRMNPSTYQWAYDPAKYIMNKLGWKKIYFIGSDYAAPREGFAAVKKVFGSKNIVGVQWPKEGTVDFSPYLSKLNPSKANGLVTAVWGADEVRLVKQYAALGLQKKLPIFGLGGFATEEFLPVMPQAMTGAYSAYTYCGGLNTTANKQFISAYEAKSGGKAPGSYALLAYAAGLQVVAAIEKVKGNVEDRSAFIKAIAATKVTTPMGRVTYDAHHGATFNFYVTRVVDHGGKLSNACVGKIPHVADPYSIFP